jgi:hypothetical protein
MRDGHLIGPIIVAIGVIVAAMAFAIVTTLLETADSGMELRVARLEAELDAAAEALVTAANETTRLAADVARLREEMSLLANRQPVAETPQAPLVSDPGAFPDEDFENIPETEALTDIMKLAKARFNKGITQPRNATMMDILGPPRDGYSTDCQPVTSATLKPLLETRQVGTITVTMLKPALDSLERVLNRLKETDPDIYAKVGTAGALCARFIRGSTTSVSNHSWGTAIDLTLQGELDRFADGGTQFGLLILAEYFNDEGWYWGAVYNREDSMHFEVGEETLRAWKAEGKL